MAVDVPRAPGVPSVNFAVGAGEILALLASDLVSFLGGGAAPWGIFLGGAPVILSDNVLTFDFRQNWSLSDYPVERGGFETYNKVDTPFQGGFRFATGGSEANKQAMLASIAAAAGSMTLYNIVTPEAVYLNVSLTKYSYARRHDQGVGLIVVDVDAFEVRVVTSAAMASTRGGTGAGTGAGNGGTKSPTSAPQSNTGSVQGRPPTPYQSQQGALVAGSAGRVPGSV